MRRNTAPTPRKAALAITHEVMADGMDLQSAIAKHGEFPRLDSRDRAFARRLITLALRHHGEAAALLAPHVQRMPRGKNRLAATAMLMAAAELGFGGGVRHAYAVIDGTIDMLKAGGLGHLGGLANAVLRRVSEGVAENPPAPQPMLNLPPWLLEKLFTDWGEAEALRIAEIIRRPPPLDLTLRDPATAEAMAGKLHAAILPCGTLRLATGGGAVSALAGYEAGAWWVQDAAAAMPVRLLGDLRGRRVADLCAAPGGKTAQLCAGGAQVTAVDSSPARIKTLRQNMHRLGFAPEIIHADAREWQGGENKGGFDVVLVDAPCSATGTLRRHPDILTRKTPPDLKSLHALQSALLAAASRLLAPGGIAFYVTCSLLRSEGEAIADNITAPLTPLPFTAEEIVAAGGEAFGLAAGTHMLRIMPHALRGQRALKVGGGDIDMDKPAAMPQGNDGFFIARFIRAADGT